MPIIELKQVSKIYGFGDATTLALNEVDFSVEAGEFVAIMGPSGSGKSTLMNIIGLLDKPTDGQYQLEGRYSERLGSNQQAKIRRDKIGFVFQSFNLLPRLNVLENTALPLAYRGLTPVRRLKRASDLLEQVGLRDREYFFPRHLSNGQAQRVAIARALVNDPKIIIADEPTGNLDSRDSLIVMELLSAIHRRGSTVLLVTHNPELTRYANRVIYMRDGIIIGDERTPIGRVAKGAQRIYYRRHIETPADIVAGVSALVGAVPLKPAPPKTKLPKQRLLARLRRSK